MRFWGAVSLDTRPESSDIERVSGALELLKKPGLDCWIPIFIAEPVVSRHTQHFIECLRFGTQLLQYRD